MVAVDDVLLEGNFVKEVVGFSATVGLVALQHLAGTPKSLIEKLSVAAGGLLERSFQTADEVSTAKRLKASKKKVLQGPIRWQAKVCKCSCGLVGPRSFCRGSRKGNHCWV